MDPQSFSAEAFFKSKRNTNCILDLEKSLLSNDETTVLQSMVGFQDVYTQIFNKNMLHSSQIGTAEENFRLWLLERYQDFVSHFIDYLTHNNKKIQGKSLEVLMALIVLEGQKSPKKVKSDIWYFPKELFQKIVCELASHEIDQQCLITKFTEYTSFDDVKMYVLKAILNLFQQADRVTDVFMLNVFSLLNILKYPKNFDSSESVEENTQTTLLLQSDIKTPFKLKEKLFCKLFTQTWVQFLKCELPSFLLKKVLLFLHKVIPHFQNPCLVTDFLTDSYRQGGIVSLLALNGLFLLMDRYNIEYPDFFLNLYSLFDEEIINGKFSSRFFYLSNLFLSSIHLPAITVAAFVKRLSRIALRSKTENILKIIGFICNLLIRHPPLQVMIHRSTIAEMSVDPYDFSTPNPVESHAMDSSLWEIKTLQNHINPEVSQKAKMINHQMPLIENDLSATMDMSSEQLYKKERKRKFVDVPPNTQKLPRLDSCWNLVNTSPS